MLRCTLHYTNIHATVFLISHIQNLDDPSWSASFTANLYNFISFSNLCHLIIYIIFFQIIFI